MINGRKNSLKQALQWILFVSVLLLTSNTFANYTTGPDFRISLTPFQDKDTSKRAAGKTDTVPRVKDTLPRIKDSLRKGTDTVPRVKDSLVSKTDTFNLRISKDTLDAPVDYKASDSIVMDVKTQKIILYSKANVKQKDMDLTAERIEVDQASKMVLATYGRDTAGNMIGRPKMIQADSKMEADSIRYNFETQRGITQTTLTQQGEMFVQGERVKKVSVNEYYALRGQITTCNLDTPHFAFRVKKMKMVSQKLAVTGPIHPEFEGIPIPIYLPFGFFPLSQGRHSGLLPPTFTASDQFGLGLEGLGYYKVFNEYWDVTLRTNIYSYGGWAAFITPKYTKRYKYQGSMNLSIQSTRILSTDPKQDFIKTQTFNIAWSHTVDNRARPGTSFSANVNAGSTKFNQFVLNDPTRNFQNQMNSSITYSKTWGSRYNLTASANHNQNNSTTLINMTLPNVAFTMNTLYPFQPKDFVGTQKWYPKLGIGLNTSFANQISIYEKDFNLSNILDTMTWGAQHNIPIQLTLPQLGPLSITPGVSYSQRWYGRRMHREYSPATGKVDTASQKGFYTAHDISFSVSMNTALFGTANFGKESRINAIRHTVRPTVSLNYKPDLSAKDFYDAYVDSTLSRKMRFSYYDGSIFGPFGEGVFGGLSFGIDNNIEAKVRSKKDTSEGGIKKVRLIDGFGFTSGYNFLADSFKLSNFNLYLRSTLFEKLNISAGATLDPYKVDSNGYRVNQYAWKGGSFSPGRITGGNLTITTSFQSKPKDEEKAKEQEEANKDLPPLTLEEQEAQLAYARTHPSEFADFNIPWSLNASFSFSFARTFRADYKGWETTTNANLNLSGDFNLTPKWKLGASTYLDVKNTSLESLSLSISREMHCWQMSINVTPVGINRYFNITISPKSGLLRDLKLNRTRYFYGM